MDEDEEFKGGWKSSLEHGRYFLKRWVLSLDWKAANVDAARGGRGGGSRTRGPEKERLPNFSRLKRGTDRISSRSTRLLWYVSLAQTGIYAYVGAKLDHNLRYWKNSVAIYLNQC